MINIFKIIKKNIKLLLRSKTSSIIIILGPMLLIFLVGVAFNNTNTYGLNIGFYTDNFTEITDGFIEKLSNQSFNVQKFDDRDLCVNAIKSGAIHTCVVFPGNLTFDQEVTNEIIFYVDYSKINLVWMIQDSISSSLQSRSKEVSQDLIQVLLDKLELTRAEIFNKNPKLQQLKTDNSDMESKAAAALDNINTMDLAFDYNSLNISSLDSIGNNYRDRINILKIYILERTHNALDRINDTKDEFDVNSSTYNALNSIYGEVEEIKEKIISEHNLTYKESLEIVSIIDNVQSKLNTVNSNLDRARTKKELVNTKLVSIKEKLALSGTSLKEIDESLKKIDSSIASLKVTNAQNIANPIETNIIPVTAETTHLNYLFPSLIVLVVMFISILLSNTLVMMEKHSSAFFRNFLVPIPNITFILATYFTNLLLVLLQALIIMSVSVIAFGSELLPNLVDIALILFLITTVFTFIGMIIGYMFKSEETSILAAISIGTTFLFLSDLILPLESMPKYILDIAKFNPFVIGQSLLRKAVLFQPHIKVLFIELGYLVGYALVLFSMILLFHYFASKRLFQKFNYYNYQRMLTRQQLLGKVMPLATGTADMLIVDGKKAGKKKNIKEKETDFFYDFFES